MNKKKEQLGMNPSTASGRLVKDILFQFIISNNNNACFRCGNPMVRENFSIDHKVPWLNSDNPLELYFDLNNIAFSHLKCNVACNSGGRIRGEQLRIDAPEGKAWCYICRKFKDTNNFYQNISRRTGWHPECKDCKTIYKKKLRQAGKNA